MRSTVLTRMNVTRFVAAACIGALVLVPASVAHAVTATDGVASTTQAINATAQRWFAAQADAARVDSEIADIEHRIAATQDDIARLRTIATARALVLYKNSDLAMTAMFGDSALDTARRARLVDDADAGGNAAIAQLVASVHDLDTQHHDLLKERAHQQKVLASVAGERRTLDAELQAFRSAAQRDATEAVAAARDRAAREHASAHLRSLTAVHVTNVYSLPTGTPLAASPRPVVAAPSEAGLVSPHHDEPFLVCTRARESGGNYGAVSPDGYYGAYQFLPSTWDSVAVHDARSDLVGVLPSRASEYDQDELAWSLYQWQGNAPWGGRC